MKHKVDEKCDGCYALKKDNSCGLDISVRRQMPCCEIQNKEYEKKRGNLV